MVITTLAVIFGLGALIWGVNRIISIRLNKKIFSSIFMGLEERADHFRFEEGDLFTSPAIYGEISQAIVDIGPRKNSYSRWIDIHISFQNDPFFNIRIQPIKMGKLIHLTTIKESMPLGDPEFDPEFYVRCSSDQVLYTFLNPQIRRSFLKIKSLCGDFYLNNDSLHLQVEQEKVVFDTVVTELFDEINTIIIQWEKIGDLKKCLIENIKKEKVVPVKIKILETLLSHFVVDFEIKTILRVFLQDKNDDIRLFAASALGDDGAAEILKALSSGDGALMMKGIIAVQRNKSKNLIRPLMTLYRNTNNEQKKLGIISSFRYIGDNSLNDFLLFELSEARRSLQKEIILALKKCGTVKALEALYQIKQKNKDDYQYTMIIDEVIKTIREKYGYTRTISGRLSISNPQTDQGNLSIDGKS